uniref:CHK kinase-like domain-containing protein n=1 Tax=Cuerna arida TaxID=1464854 RepID=A0A1B6FHP3_9HEMI
MTEVSYPEWLTGDFLQSCLESDKENFDGITVTSHELEYAVAPGNNYGSHIIRANIQYKKPNEQTSEHSVSLILKAPLSEDSVIMQQLGDVIKKLYLNEIKYYCEFISETYKLIKHDVVPKHYKSPNPLCLVMEDLSVSGFKMVDRRRLLDFDHCKLFTEASAKLHALGIALHKTNPELIESFGTDSITVNEKLKVTMPNTLVCMAAYLEDKPDYKKQFHVIREASENDIFWTIYKNMLDDCKSKVLRTLIQDDPWCTNMMFRYDNSGRAEGIKILDFQTVKLNYSLLEFVMFLTAAANMDVRENKLNDLYQMYCDSLNGNLAELGCPEKLSIEEMETEITHLSPLMFYWVCGLPITLTDSAVDMEEYISVRYSSESVKDTSLYKTAYTGLYFDMYYPQILDVYEKLGVYDYISGKVKEIKSKM